MFVLKHKRFPFYLTWETEDAVFDAYKSQIEMEIKENGLSGFDINFTKGKSTYGDGVENELTKTTEVQTPPPPLERPKNSGKPVVVDKSSKPNKNSKPIDVETPSGSPTVPGSSEDKVSNTKAKESQITKNIKSRIKAKKEPSRKPTKKRRLFSKEKS